MLMAAPHPTLTAALHTVLISRRARTALACSFWPRKGAGTNAVRPASLARAHATGAARRVAAIAAGGVDGCSGKRNGRSGKVGWRTARALEPPP